MTKRLTYPLPSVTNPDDQLCVKLLIPDEQGHRGAFLGAIHTLTRWYSWDRDEEKRGKDVAGVWQPIYDRLEFELGDEICESEGLPMLRQNPDNFCQQQYLDPVGNWVTFFDYSLCDAFKTNLNIQAILNYSETNIANGITAQELADYLSNESGYSAQVAINAQNQANRDKLLCLALRVIFEVYLETLKNNLEQARRNEITLSMIVGAGLALAFAPLSPIVVGSILASFSVGALVGASQVSYADLTDQTARDKVICHAYETLFGDNLTRAGFSTVYDVVPFPTDSPEYRQSQALKDLMHTVQAYLAVINFMMEKLPSVDALVNECDECISPTQWVHTFDFAVNNGDWLAITVPQNNPQQFGNHNGGAWQSTDGLFGGRYRRAIYIRRDFADSTVTKVQVYVDFTRGSFDQNISSHLLQSATGTGYANTIRASILASNANDATDYFEWNGSVTMRRLELQMASSHKFTANYSGVMKVTKVIVTGNGVNPFI